MGEVRIAVRAAAVNPVDWKRYSGTMGADAKLPLRLGFEVAGVVVEVLVHAAAGGVGLMAVQLAVARGARVIGTASERNHPYLRELGAEPTTYGEGLADRGVGHVTGKLVLVSHAV
jgi:NADPH:quinone reductase-like Zn-dependent oxidoreductase